MVILRLLQMIRYLFTRRLGQKTESFLEDAVSRFSAVLVGFEGHYVSHRELEGLKETWHPVYRKMKATWIPKSHRYYTGAQSLLTVFPVLDKTVADSNKAFVIAEKKRYETLFSDIDGRSLDDQQRTVVVTGEDSNLVLAGAGSGKTLTISGKVKYLCEAKGVKPEDILLIAFTRKAADEMRDRISHKLGIKIDTFTFHKLGLGIIAAARNEKPDVDDDLKKYVATYLTKTVVSRSEEIKRLIEYFAYYLKIPANLEMFDSLGDAYDYERGADLETLQSKYEQARYVMEAEEEGLPQRQTLKHEKVKSLAEVEIANFLFLNGVNYEYERKYPFPTSDSTHRAYRPDFYLPDYDGEADKCGDLIDLIQKKGLDSIRVSAKEQIVLGQAEIEVDPALVEYDPIEENDNDASLIIKIYYQDDEWLLPGDIEKEAIEVWLSENTQTFDIVKMPHHGRKEGNTKEFIENTDPSIAVITDSTEDEANKKVLKQLDKKNIPYYRSSVDGTITITGNGSGIYEVTKEE